VSSWEAQFNCKSNISPLFTLYNINGTNFVILWTNFSGEKLKIFLIFFFNSNSSGNKQSMMGYVQPSFVHFIFIGPNFLYWRYRTRNHRLQLSLTEITKGDPW
jgi:hypothetical protein